MLTLLPLSSLQAAIKRRNSKTSHDFPTSRRGSISVYSTYSLPNSKSFMRRYSSFEELDPDQLQMLAEKAKIAKEESVLSKFARRQSVPAVCVEQPECTGLDAQLAKIRRQLAQLKNEDIDMAHRVDSLHSSVESLSRHRGGRPSSAPASMTTSDRDAASVLPMTKTASGNSLQAIHEECWEIRSDSIDSGCLSSSEEEEEEEESFEEYCRAVITRFGRTPIHRSGKSARPNPISFTALDVEEPIAPKQYCLPNNLELRPKTKSSPQLEIVRNDLSKHDFDCPRPERLSVISCQSDSILFSSQYRQQ